MSGQASGATSSSASSGSSSSSSTVPSTPTTSASTTSTTTPSTSTTPPSTSSTSPTTTPNSQTSTASGSGTSIASDSTSFISSPATTSTFQTTSLAVSDGVTYTTLITETTTLASGSSGSSGSSSHQTNTGAIVGGVVGGVGGLAVLLLLIFLVIRWQKKRDLDKEFDGDFDPGRTAVGRTGSAGLGGTLPNVRVPEEDDGMGGRLAASDLGIRGTVTPFFDPRQTQQQMSEKARLLAHDNSSLHQAGPSNRAQSPVTFPVPQPASVIGSSSSDAGYQQTAGSSSVGGYYSQTPMQHQQQRQNYHSPTSSEIASSRGAKDREARPTLANPDQVIVHQDGGRVEEIPPTYDSLPAEERR